MTPESTRDTIIAAITRLAIDRDTPIVVALDGRSGSGKSLLASMIAEALGAALIQSDDFFAASIADAEWDARTPDARAADAIDWRRLRAEALEPLRAGRPARWHAFDFVSGTDRAGRYGMRTDFVERDAAPVVVLDGAYSTRPELTDLIDLSVLIEASDDVRRERLAAREESSFLEQWHVRWDAAEEAYFSRVRPRSAFDLVITNEGGSS